MTIGQRLYEMRKQKCLSQEQVADVLGVTRQTVSKWETDQTTPDFDKILPLCELYNITSDELLKGETQQKQEYEHCAYNNNSNSNTYTDYSDNNKNNTPSASEPDEQEKELYEKYKRKSALIISGAIFLYIMSVTPFFIFTNEKIMLSSFFALIAIATMMIVFISLSKPKKSVQSVQKTAEDKFYKQITRILSGFTLVVYMLISFITGMWNITWILWVIYGIVCQIIKLIFLLKGSEINDDE